MTEPCPSAFKTQRSATNSGLLGTPWLSHFISGKELDCCIIPSRHKFRIWSQTGRS